MRTMVRPEDAEHPRGFLGLLGLIFGLALGGAALYAVAGLPHLPAALPSWDVVVLTLRGSDLPPETLGYLLTTAAWVLWLWIVASLLLRSLVVAAEVATRGAAWVSSLRALSDLVTLPFVRRVVDGALIALVVVNVAGRGVPAAAAAPLAPVATAVASAAPARVVLGDHIITVEGGPEQRQVEYTVQPGDTLWSISERFYGAGGEYTRLVDANVGRRMPDGLRFTRAGVIYPGWVLLVEPEARASSQSNVPAYYVVQESDTLRGIAAHFLGDETRWPEIFDLNRSKARLEDGRVLANPDLIWPGLRLRLPQEAARGSSEQTSPATGGAVKGEPTVAAATPTVEAQPTPVPAAPTPKPAPPPNERGAAEAPAAAVESQPPVEDGSSSPFPYGSAALAATAALAGASLLARRRVRRSLDEPPIPSEPEPPPSDDFAEAEFARVLTHQLHGGEVEGVTLVAEHALRFLAEHGLDDVAVIMARQGSSSTALTLATGLLGQPLLLELAERFASHLGGKALATLTPDHDVLLRIAGPSLAGLLSPSTDQRAEAPCLLPLGVLPKGDTVYANWHELGHVLIAGLPGGGAEVILTSFVSALAARRRPGDLGLWTIARHRTLPGQLEHLPHQLVDAVDPADPLRVSEVLEHMRAELLRRMRAAEGEAGTPSSRLTQPEIVLLIGELGEVEDEAATLELIGTHGPSHGMRLLAATTNAAALGEDMLAHFVTRLVLQTLDNGESIQLLGRPEAADLGSGDLLFRIDGRVPVRARGFRVSADHLRELIRLMRGAYGEPRQPAATTAVAPEAAEGEELPAGDELPTSSAGEAVFPEGRGDVASESATGDPATRIGPIPHQAASGMRGGIATAVAGEAPAPQGSPSGNAMSLRVVPVGEAPRNGHSPDEHGGAILLEDAAAIKGPEPSPAPAEGLDVADGRPAEAAVPGAEAASGPLHSGGEPPAHGAPVQIRCFGEFVVTSGERVIEPSLDDRVCFKSFELLAFLASHPDGAVPKDKLLAALWPDADAERAANRMRVEMARLRALLARQVEGLPAESVRCERDGTCRLDTRLIASDVHRFLELCRAAPKLPPEQAKAALEQAREVYRGDFLTGRGARFYEWVDDPGETGLSLRASFREEYNRATLRLARMLCREGKAAQAVPLYKSLLKAEPTLEDIVRELYRCYQQLGDLASLIREDRHVRQALREAYYDPDDPEDDPDRYQPEPETVELFEEICKELEAKAAARENGNRAGGRR